MSYQQCIIVRILEGSMEKRHDVVIVNLIQVHTQDFFYGKIVNIVRKCDAAVANVLVL
jgi:hypothetical protein